MKEMVLLGAGASREAGVPTATEMTKRMLQEFEQESKNNISTQILRFVIGALIFNGTCEGKSPYGELNIEDVFNAIDLLANRDKMQANAFATWHPLIQKLELQKPSPVPLPTGVTQKDILDYGADYFNSMLTAIRSIEQRETYNNPKIFNNTQEYMLKKLVKMCWVIKEKVHYLEPLVKHISQQRNESYIATLNYDNTIEQAAENLNLVCGTGIHGWNKERTAIDYGNICLLKLHGSVTWKITHGVSNAKEPIPHDDIVELEEVSLREDKLSYEPAVIFGGENKLTAKGPYLEIFKNFRDYLDCSDSLTVIGYSFQDEHINDVIVDWLNRNSKSKICIINGKGYKAKKGIVADFIERIQQRVTIIYKNAPEGIKELYGVV